VHKSVRHSVIQSVSLTLGQFSHSVAESVTQSVSQSVSQPVRQTLSVRQR